MLVYKYTMVLNKYIVAIVPHNDSETYPIYHGLSVLTVFLYEDSVRYCCNSANYGDAKS